MFENFGSRFEDALKSENPAQSLRELTKQFLAEGATREEITEEIVQFHVFLMAQGRDSDDDLILDLGDAIDGFCHPSMRI